MFESEAIPVFKVLDKNVLSFGKGATKIQCTAKGPARGFEIPGTMSRGSGSLHNYFIGLSFWQKRSTVFATKEPQMLCTVAIPLCYCYKNYERDWASVLDFKSRLPFEKDDGPLFEMETLSSTEGKRKLA